jgi:hypothetical protein
MNYYRGFQRLYLVLFITYVGVFLWNAPARRLAFWKDDELRGAAKQYEKSSILASCGFDSDAARQAGYSNDEILAYLGSTRKFDISEARNAGYREDAIIKYLSVLRCYDILSPEKQVLMAELSRRFNATQSAAIRVPVDSVPFVRSRTGKALWLFSYLVLAPALLYSILFHVFRWVYVGFRPSKAN